MSSKKNQNNKEIGYIKNRDITDEMRESYVDYAMSVIVSRALPDVRDGLKPVHRRILYSMYKMGLTANAKFRKSATVVGRCMGQYHPHGDQAIYDALVRMAQEFSLRYPLVQGQGNFGCFTKDTKVCLCDGRDLSFGELIKEQKQGKRHWTFSFNPETERIEIAEIKHPRLTRKQEQIIEITLDNNEKIRCTLDHLFMLRNGTYKQAQFLQEGDSLMPGYFNTAPIKRGREELNEYLQIKQPITGKFEFVHRLSEQFNKRQGKVREFHGPFVRHHKDFNRFNNNPDNIERLGFLEHLKVHAQHAREMWKSDDFRKNQKRGVKEFFKNNPEAVEKCELESYNHKVVKTKILKRKQCVYDLTTEPWHNFLLSAGVFVHNSQDGDAAAAQRYTECKLSSLGEAMLQDIEKDTVAFQDNYDGTRQEPQVLPSPVPQLLLNGSLGIAVGMATSIPPHNLGEIIGAAVYLIDHPNATTEDLFEFIKGPDFPTGGIVYGKEEMIAAYSQGKGQILVRGKAEVQQTKGGTQIIISEIPYGVKKADLVRTIAKLSEEKRIKGISFVRDESDRKGLRIVVRLRQGYFPKRVLNALYKYTPLQQKFYLNMLALVDGIQPKVMSLVEVLQYYLKHKKEVVVRRTRFDLKKARERAHIVEGLVKALKNIDAVIKTIKASPNRTQASQNLRKKFGFTEKQAEAILDMRLHRLAKMEREELEKELEELRRRMKELEAILKSSEKQKELMKKELLQFKQSHSDARKTKVYVQKPGKIAKEELIPQEETIITITKSGYIKRSKPSLYRSQQRGGKGVASLDLQEKDKVEHFLRATTTDTLFFFTAEAKVFQQPCWEIPEMARTAKGRGLVNFIEVSQGQSIVGLLTYPRALQGDKTRFLVMVTKNGIIKKTKLSQFDNIRRSGLRAGRLKKGDELRQVVIASNDDELILTTKKGQAIRFQVKELRPMSRDTSGVKGIRLGKGDEVADMAVIKKQLKGARSQAYLLVVTQRGYAKRTLINKYRPQKRGGSGLKAVRIKEKTGEVVFAKVVSEQDKDLLVVSEKGQVIRLGLDAVSILNRITSGVKVIKLAPGDKVTSAICL